MGKFNFSPKREQTPNACSSKNNFNFSMGMMNYTMQIYKKTSVSNIC